MAVARQCVSRANTVLIACDRMPHHLSVRCCGLLRYCQVHSVPCHIADQDVRTQFLHLRGGQPLYRRRIHIYTSECTICSSRFCASSTIGNASCYEPGPTSVGASMQEAKHVANCHAKFVYGCQWTPSKNVTPLTNVHLLPHLQPGASQRRPQKQHRQPRGRTASSSSHWKCRSAMLCVVGSEARCGGPAGWQRWHQQFSATWLNRPIAFVIAQVLLRSGRSTFQTMG